MDSLESVKRGHSDFHINHNVPFLLSTLVEAELTLAETGGVTKLTGDLFGPSMGILVWRDDQRRPQAATMAEYNRRYWKALAGVEIPANMRPQQFPIIDRFIGGDDDRRAWQEGIEQLQRAGFSAIMLPPSRPIRDILVKAGGRRTAWASSRPCSRTSTAVSVGTTCKTCRGFCVRLGP